MDKIYSVVILIISSGLKYNPLNIGLPFHLVMANKFVTVTTKLFWRLQTHLT